MEIAKKHIKARFITCIQLSRRIGKYVSNFNKAEYITMVLE